MQNTIDALEWQSVLDHLAELCQTGYARVLIESPDFLSQDISRLQHSMAIVDEGKIILQRYGDISLQEPADIVPALERLEKGGTISSSYELSEVLTALKAMRQIVRHLVQNATKNETPLLIEEITEITSPNHVIEMLEAMVYESGELKDSASPAYATLRKKVVDAKARVIDMLNATMRNPSVAKSLQETVVTEREGRFVLSVKAENRADVPGIVLGSSTTGSTLYIEPSHVIEVQNQFKSVLGELDQEIRRILEQVSENLRPDIEVLIVFIEKTAGIDLLLAKARQSLALKANPVLVLEEPGMLKLRSAKHPLLIRQLEHPHVVANDILLESPYKTILITGPNTGGKTVLLKLIGLFALMVEAGLHLPCAEGSSMSLFNPVLIDIGDPQSIEQNLSTFSGHMARMKSFLDEPDLSKSLILVDEICAGTDPQEGAALAEALLEAFYNRGATTVATTHIGELKVAAHQHPGYLNASVAFDEKTLGPTYQLLLGVPGTSHAIEIAGYLGIDKTVLESARGKLSKPQSEASELIADLQMKNKVLNDELATVQKLREEIAWEEEQLRTQLNRLEGEKRKTLQLFREGLSQKFRVIEREVDDLKKDLQSSDKPDSQTLVQYSKRFKHAQSEAGQVFTEETQKLYPNPGIAWDKLAVGDTVSSRSLNMTGVIIEKHEARKEVTIQAGILKTTLPVSDIISQQKQVKSSNHKSGRKSGGGKNTPLPSALSLDCDVRGMRADDAVLMVENTLDEAIQKGYGAVNVIHGLGTGALKKAIREHLKKLPYVRSFTPAAAIEGGDGKTIITL